MSWLWQLVASLRTRLACPAPLCPLEQAWQAWVAEYDSTPGSVRERELWLAYNLLTVGGRRAA